MNPPELEKATIEPGSQQVFEVRFDGRPQRMIAQFVQEATPDVDEHTGSVDGDSNAFDVASASAAPAPAERETPSPIVAA